MLRVKNLEESLRFYQSLPGLRLSVRDDASACLRGVEETSHHSLILARADAASCDALGFRVLEPSDLDRAEAYFAARNIVTARATRPGPGADAVGPP